MKKDLVITNQNTQLIKKVSTGLSITKKILPATFDEVEWWNSLPDIFKKHLTTHLYHSDKIYSSETNISELIEKYGKLNLNKQEIKNIFNLEKITINTEGRLILSIKLAMGSITKTEYNERLEKLELNSKILNNRVLPKLINLTEIHLCCYINDISSLSKLYKLKKIDLSYNRISDITPLCNLTQLKFLNLYGNPIPIEDIEWLRKKLPNCDIHF